MTFRVRAVDRAQQVLTLQLDALDEADAREQLRQRQLTPLSIAHDRPLIGGSRQRFSTLMFLEELQALVSAGLSVIEALEALVEKESNADARAILGRLIGHLRSGMRLSQALQQQSSVFPALLIGIVQAAEGASDLPASLQRYLQYQKRIGALRQVVISAAIYPAVLMFVGSLVSVFLLGYVVPRFAAIYQTGGRELALGSRLLLSWGAFVQSNGLTLLIGVLMLAAALVFGVRHLLRTGKWSEVLQVFPGARQRLMLFELSRAYLTLGMLLQGGIPVTHALQLARSVVSPLRQAGLDAARVAVETGTPLSEAFARHQLSTTIALKLIRVGEQSGQLGSMLGHAAAFYEEENTRWIERFTKTFEPLLMAAIGLVIGLIVVLLYMPIFDLAGSLQ